MVRAAEHCGCLCDLDTMSAQPRSLLLPLLAPLCRQLRQQARHSRAAPLRRGPRAEPPAQRAKHSGHSKLSSARPMHLVCAVRIARRWQPTAGTAAVTARQHSQPTSGPGGNGSPTGEVVHPSSCGGGACGLLQMALGYCKLIHHQGPTRLPRVTTVA